MTNFDLDHMIEMLDDKIVRTDQGSFIKVEDLKQLQQQVHEAEREQRAGPRPRTMAQARAMAKADPEVQAAHANPTPRAPAFSSVKGVAPQEGSR